MHAAGSIHKDIVSRVLRLRLSTSQNMEIFLRVLPLLYAVQFAFFLMGVHGRPLSITTKPDPDDAAATARWLVSLNSWGVELKLVDKKSEEAEFARSALFSKHSEMQGWPKDHDFGVY